jgi:hemerythrin-like domain-containing protein
MTTRPAADLPDVQEMVVIHRIFRRGFEMLADAARRVSPADTARMNALEKHAGFLLSGLHHHHAMEDEHLWPRLAERAQSQSALAERMAEQHHTIAQQIEKVQLLLPRWRISPDEAFPRSIEALGEELAAHLDEEETKVLPLVLEHISAAEWQKAGDAAFDRFTNDEKLIALGQMLDVATPEEAASFLRKLPLPVRAIWRLAGRRSYERYMRSAFGPAR